MNQHNLDHHRVEHLNRLTQDEVVEAVYQLAKDRYGDYEIGRVMALHVQYVRRVLGKQHEPQVKA